MKWPSWLPFIGWQKLTVDRQVLTSYGYEWWEIPSSFSEGEVNALVFSWFDFLFVMVIEEPWPKS